MDGLRHIVAVGGGAETPEQLDTLFAWVLALTGKERPRVLLVPTAGAEHDGMIAIHLERFARRTEPTVLRTFPWPPSDLRDVVLSQDSIFVGGGNTANMLAIWRVHGIDGMLREAWERGILLWGWSAGMICWFEHGVTDSFGPQLERMACLGFLGGSACPHYDGEELRRPRYRELVDAGLPAGVAADDGVAIHFVDGEIAEVVSCRPGAAAYRVTREGEQPLETRLLV